MIKRKFTEEHIKRLSESHKGYKQSLEQIEKRVAKLKGKKRSDEFRKKVGEWMKGNKNGIGHEVNEEVRRKISEANKGNKYALGCKRSEEFKKKSSEARKGIKHPEFSGKNHPLYGIEGERHQCWKGDNVGYGQLHRWVEKHLGKPTKCERCGKIVENTKSIHWANVDHVYKRNLSDFLRLCASCHKKYDIKKGLIHITQ